MIPEHRATCAVCGGQHQHPISSADLRAARGDRATIAAARLLLPFTERAWGHPDAERIMRDGLAFLAEFCDGGRVEPVDEPTMLRSAARFLDRNYPTAVAA